MKTNSLIQKKSSSRLHQWMNLFVAFIFLGLVVSMLIPWITHLPTINTMIESNNSKGIDATGLFYTETPEFAQSENYLRNTDVGN